MARLQTNAVMLVTIANAGTLERIKRSQRVRVTFCTNLPNDGRDDAGVMRYFVETVGGVESLAYRHEFRIDAGKRPIDNRPPYEVRHYPITFQPDR